MSGGPERVRNAAYEMVPVGVLKQHERNPNRGDVLVIAESIEENGFYGAVVAQRSTGKVLAGNHRLQAARSAGLAEVPVIWLDVDDREALRILLADNQLAKLATYDDAVLVEVLRDLEHTGSSLRGTGYEDVDLQRLAEELAEEEEKEAPAPKEKDDDGDSAVLEHWGVIVQVETEDEQTELLLRFNGRGLDVRALMG